MIEPARVRLTGTLSVGLPPAETLQLFTATGERRWVEGWDPGFPAGSEEDGEPGSVFTSAHGGQITVWVVMRSELGKGISYASIRQGERAGTLAIDCAAAADGVATTVTVTWDMTSLVPEDRPGLAAFAAGYPAMLAGWERAIAAAIGG
ncbi:MAG TPA: SRPBCC family protein [Candidatus Binatia bacterium]|nr:SRPBCC family protein [Candidatus Binatia bacterium]